MTDKWMLATAEKVLSKHDTRESARRAALGYVKNGERVLWEETSTPLEVASDIGFVARKERRFVVYRY